ncbi:MAG: transposase, partial [Planctomycetota bacterium]
GRHVFLATGPTDMRKSFNGLSGIGRNDMKGDPVRGDLFVFCNRLRNRLKVLVYDDSGAWGLAKRLEQGTFDGPRLTGAERRLEYSEERLTLLLGGLDAEDLRARKWRRRKDESPPVIAKRILHFSISKPNGVHASGRRTPQRT